MTLSAGTRLGPYEIQSALGAGGMGEVYRARDTKLSRDVALKVLPELFATDPDRLARFQREAQVLASLHHPNIAIIHGLEESNGIRALVLELVEGPTLADRLEQGAVPLDEAMPIARQIAEALEAAHERGVIHRDLKPANIKLTAEGQVKVLDFGLAAVVQDPSRPDVNATNSPTLTLGATRAGVILGTAAYMSPEQAAGKPVDKRADIWSFGVVLWEMLTGKKLFDGETVSHTLADVLRATIDFDQVPRTTPVAVRALLERCLDRDVKCRLRDIGEARVQIERYLTNPRRASEPAGPTSSWSRLAIGAAFAAAVLLVAFGALSIVHLRETPPATPTTRFQVLPPDKATAADYPTISPDGLRLAFVATVEGKTLLWIRPLDSLAARSLAGTEDATSPFWSPDSRFLAFFSSGKLKKVDVSGGPPQTLCNAAGLARGGTWSSQGTILFSAGQGTPIWRVPAAGGTPARVTTVDSALEQSHNWPQFLPDGRHFLYWVFVRAQDPEKNSVIIGSLDDRPDSPERRRLLPGDSMALYSAGHLLFDREGVLMAQPFDAARLQWRGDPFPVVQQVNQVLGRYGWRAFSVSSDGSLVYRAGAGTKTQLAWFDRTGKEVGRLGQPEDQLAPSLSPDQKRVAVAQRDARGQLDIWLLELARDTSTRFTTFQPAINSIPVWSPDSGRIVFNSNRDGHFDLYVRASSGAGNDEPLLKSSDPKSPTDWSFDGRLVLYQVQDPKTKYDLWVLPLEGDRKPVPVLQTEFNEMNGRFSPDGRWIAYQSDESTRAEVYVQRFPMSSGKVRVSTNGGNRPRWRRDGKELFYLNPDGKMMAVEVKATATALEAARPRELFQTRVASALFGAPTYDVTADGQRFLIDTALDEAGGPTPMTVVMNWAPKK
ncbi:MAG TPA: protein kinase [Vicinamibacterales bacterium]|nr:protein kinase [Vicinamibacterales bacterium]